MDINVKSQLIFFPLLIFIILKLRWSFCWCPCCNGTWLDIDISSLFVVAERHRFYFEGNEPVSGLYHTFCSFPTSLRVFGEYLHPS